MSEIKYLFEESSEQNDTELKKEVVKYTPEMKGFAIALESGYCSSDPKNSIFKNDLYYLISPSLYEAFLDVVKMGYNLFDNGGLGVEVSKLDLDDYFLDFSKKPRETIRNIINENSKTLKCSDVYCWSGLIPNLKNVSKGIKISSYDPNGASLILKHYFSNSDKIMPMYHGLEDKDLAFKDEDYFDYFIRNPHKTYIIESEPELRKRVKDKLEEMGLRDLGKTGKALKSGLI